MDNNNNKRPREEEQEELAWDLVLAHCRIATMVPGQAEYGVICPEGNGAIGIAAGKLVYVGPLEALRSIFVLLNF